MCVFCNIAQGIWDSKKVYEDDDVLAILDLSQATKGHTLVIPKKHYANILKIDKDEYMKVMEKVKIVSEKLYIKLKPEGFNILNNCGEVAGQTVNHFHVHIIPRYDEKDINISFTDHSNDYNLDDVLAEINK